MKVTNKQIVSGMTTAGPLAILLARFILWVNGESVEKDLQQELVRVDAEREVALHELAYYKKRVEERYETEWKVTKDGKRRYRKVATKILANRWRTESEAINAGCGLPCDGFGKEIKEPDYVLEDRACRNPFYEDANDEIKAVLAH